MCLTDHVSNKGACKLSLQIVRIVEVWETDPLKILLVTVVPSIQCIGYNCKLGLIGIGIHFNYSCKDTFVTQKPFLCISCALNVSELFPRLIKVHI